MSRRRFSSYLIIQNWNVDDVQQFLAKNGFGDCCEAFKKRSVDGHTFLTLTEGQLMLWKRDLSLVNIRKISRLIQDLSQEPEKYTFTNYEKNGTTPPPVKTNLCSTFRPPTVNQNSIQKEIPRGSIGTSKISTGGVASIVSNMEYGGRQAVNNINSSFNTGLLAKNGSLHVKKPLFQQTRHSESSSSSSDNCSWDTNFSDDEAPMYLNALDTEEQNNICNQSENGKSILERADSIQTQLKLLECPIPPVPCHVDASPSRNTSVFTDSSVPRPEREKLQKPQVPQRSDVSPSRNEMPGQPPPVQMSGRLPAPPIQQLKNPLHVKKLLDSLTAPAAVEKTPGDEWDEEYESIDNENLPSKEAIIAFTQGFTSQKSSSQLSLSSSRDVNEERSSLTSSNSQKNLQNGWSPSIERQLSNSKVTSPPELAQMLEKNLKMTAVHQSPTVPASKRLPPSIPMTSRPLPPQPGETPSVSTNSSFAFREPARLPSEEEEQYELVEDPHSPRSPDSGNMSDEYESINQPKQQPCADFQEGGNDYYLKPLAMQNNSEPARPVLPPKPAASMEIPPLEPPSLPIRESEDLGSTSSSPGNSADGVTGLFGDFFRKKKNKLPPSNTNTIEREKTPTPEVKKSQPLPPPDHKPPPPVAYQNQRPLPPTPESSKLPSNAKEQNSAGSRRGSRSTAITQMPWYHNVDRKGAEELLKNSQDGTFLLRPSSQTQNPLSLTLLYNNRIYNISVRHRPDGKYALGYEKPNEQSFTSIEEIVNNYQSENLVLYSNGERTGRTLLTGWPPRRD